MVRAEWHKADGTRVVATYTAKTWARRKAFIKANGGTIESEHVVPASQAMQTLGLLNTGGV